MVVPDNVARRLIGQKKEVRKIGQYYIVCNIDKKEYIDPHCWDDGAKLLEFALSTEGTMTALAILLADGNDRGGGDLHTTSTYVGRWAGDRIVITGDYADAGKFTDTGDNLYDTVTYYKTGKKVRYDYDPTTLHDETIPNPEWHEVSADVMAALLDDSYIRHDIEEKMKGFKLSMSSAVSYAIRHMQYDEALSELQNAKKRGEYVPSIWKTYIRALAIREKNYERAMSP